MMYDVRCMKRTQLNFDEKTYYQLVSYARENKTSLSSAVRKIVNRELEKPTSKIKNPLLGLAKLGEKYKDQWKGPHDLSTKIDYYLYGPGSPEWDYLYKTKKKK